MHIGRSGPSTLDRWLPSIQSAVDGIWARVARATGGLETARIMILGAERKAGTTVIAAATAIGLARNLRRQVALIEADVSRPRLAGYLDLDPTPGLAEYLAGDAEIPDICRTLPGENLIVVPGGAPRPPVPGEFATEAARNLMDDLVGRTRFVIVDAPPIHERSESRVILGQIDAAVLVLSASSSKVEDARRTIRLLEGIPLIGTVLNRFKPTLPFAGIPPATS